MGDEGERHVRRKRYRGSHPRAFSEKYKELQGDRYREDLERVLGRGDTPAGSHRSIMVREILELLAPKPGDTAIDATLGHGGHSSELLKAIQPGGFLFGFDTDSVELAKTTGRLRDEGWGEGSFIPVHANFSRLREVLTDAGLEAVDLFLADLGLSSMQIDDPERGFSFKLRGPLDMRMDQGSGPSARELLATLGEEALRDILRDNADEASAGEIARAIHLRRGRLSTTRDLTEAILSAFPGLAYKDPATAKILRRAFQAIRIEVNGEFRALEKLLADLPSCMKPGARLAFLSFHSGEDRRVEAALAEGLESGLYSAVSPIALRPGREEQYSNPRSSSAKLRWALRAGHGEGQREGE